MPAKGVVDVSPCERDSAISTVGQAVGAVAMSEDQSLSTVSLLHFTFYPSFLCVVKHCILSHVFPPSILSPLLPT